MPLIITTPFQIIPTVSAWFHAFGSGSGETGYGATLDSTGNLYVGGTSYFAGQTFGNQDSFLTKFNSDGVNQFGRLFGGSGQDEGYSLAVDSSDNMYLVGDTRSSGAGNDDLFLAKYNSSGVIQWQRTLGTGASDESHGVAIDSSSNIYIGGRFNGNDLVLAKYNSSGTIQWQRVLTGAGAEQGGPLAIDSLDNVYIMGHTTTIGAGGFDLFLAKYNSSGVIQWQRTLGGVSNDEWSNDGEGGLAVDSNNDVYITGRTESTGAGGADCIIAKYNSSGVIQWQRTLGSAQHEDGYGLTTDASNNVYVVGKTSVTTGAGSFDMLVAKYNSSGVIQWQRAIGGTSSDRATSVLHNGSGVLYVVGYSSSIGTGNHTFIAKIPDDGTLTGTYSVNGNNITYQSISLTDQSSSLTDAVATLSEAAGSLTNATSSLSDKSITFTEYHTDF